MSVIKATMGGEPVEIWFAPGFNIKTTDKRTEDMIRTMERTLFDPSILVTRKVNATKSIIDSYLILDHLMQTVPELKIEIKEAPELYKAYEDKNEGDPVTH